MIDASLPPQAAPYDSPQAALDYERIEKAIRFIEANVTRQPGLAEIADAVHLSPFHFERMFSRWAGTTPQRFLRYLTKEYARQLLEAAKDVAEVSYRVGLSGPGRLHDLFVTYEAMSPGEYKGRGRGLEIAYGMHPTPFGPCLLAVTARGVCGLTFLPAGESGQALLDLQAAWPEARLAENPALTGTVAGQLFAPAASPAPKPVHLLLRGTNFQIKVWEALLRIPAGALASYETLAAAAGSPKAVRAVGTACGSNQIAYLIPCHRVLQKAGGIGGYRWGTSRKRAMLAWEAAQGEGHGA
jgi:AraC family transcriptional regulator of adaptative response/methylated-DNA-[protein]-cysteine methyltransferase